MQTVIFVLVGLVAPVAGPVAVVVPKVRVLSVLLRFGLRFVRATHLYPLVPCVLHDFSTLHPCLALPAWPSSSESFGDLGVVLLDVAHPKVVQHCVDRRLEVRVENGHWVIGRRPMDGHRGEVHVFCARQTTTFGVGGKIFAGGKIVLYYLSGK